MIAGSNYKSDDSHLCSIRPAADGELRCLITEAPAQLEESAAEVPAHPEHGREEATQDGPPQAHAQVPSNQDQQCQTQTKQIVVIDSSYQCQFCASKFKTYFQLKSHLTQHKGEQVSADSSCLLTFFRLGFEDFLPSVTLTSPAGLQVCVEVLLADLPEAGSVPGAHQDAPGAADLPLPPLQQGVPLAVRTGSPPVLPLLLPATERTQGNQHLQVGWFTRSFVHYSL